VEVEVMRARALLTLGSLGVVAILVGCLMTGCGGVRTATEGSTASSGMVGPSAPEPAVKSDGPVLGGATGAPQSYDAAAQSPRSTPNSLVISTAGIAVEVKDLDSAIAAVRTIATKYGASIANLSLSAGGAPTPVPQPLGGTSAESGAPSPGGATVTLRVPANRLAATEQEVAALGHVLSQSASQDDVTQQHVDMSARLKNLQAEEARLRTFFLKAKNVSEMLAIEQELARVRGEIESMQAQITYLERQAALATLTISLSEPGAIVSPSTGGWGFLAAVRDGIRAAAAVVRTIITTVLAFSPIIVLGLALFLVVRAVFMRRRPRRSATTQAVDTSAAPRTGPTTGSPEDR
jgi:hypothetical protein